MESLLSFPHDDEVEYKGSDPNAAMNGIEDWSTEQYLRVSISLRGLDPLRIKFFEKLGQKLSSSIPPLLLLFLDSIDCWKDTLADLDRLVFQNINRSETQVLMEVSHPNQELFLILPSWCQLVRLRYLNFTKIGQTEIPHSFFLNLAKSSSLTTIGFEDIEAEEVDTVLECLSANKTRIEKLRLKNCIKATRSKVDEAAARSFRHEALPGGIELFYPLPTDATKEVEKVEKWFPLIRNLVAKAPDADAGTQGWVNCAVNARMIAKKKKLVKQQKQKEETTNARFRGRTKFLQNFFYRNSDENNFDMFVDQEDSMSLPTLGVPSPAQGVPSPQAPRLSFSNQRSQVVKRTNTSHQRKRVSGFDPRTITRKNTAVEIPEAEETNTSVEPVFALSISSDI